MIQGGILSEKEYEELALRLYCAYLSYQLGISYKHCMKTYLQDIKLDDYWYILAENVACDMANAIKIKDN